MPIRVGFLIGKDTDLVEDPKYVGDASFLIDMPDKYRVDPESKDYLKDCDEGTKGFAHADVAIPWYMHKHHKDIEAFSETSQSRKLGCSRSVTMRRSTGAAVPESDGTLGVAERYSSEDWFEHLQNFPLSIILKRVKSHLAFNAVFALSVQIVNYFTGLVRPPPLALLSACSTALGLLLVFRTTADAGTPFGWDVLAYERWCAGYRCVRETKQHLQQLRRLARLWMSEEDLEWMDGQLATFPAYLGTFLGGGVGARGKSWALLGEMERDPREILVTFGEGIYKCLAKDPSSAALYTEDRMQGHITGALASIEEMAQIVTVPVSGRRFLARSVSERGWVVIPETCLWVSQEYSRHTSRFLTVYLLILPFALVELQAFMPLAVTILAWALLSIEEIGHTLEDPFNSPTQRLGLRTELGSLNGT
eukprot:g7108.t1